MKYYAGIGARATPPNILKLMTEIASHLESKDYILRSGGAIGADSAFELGVLNNKKEIFRWKECTKEAEEIAATIHPAWHHCNEYARKSHGRNVFQILGKDLNTPVEFVICWTPNAQEIGGTRTAIVLAKKRNIKVYNLANEEDLGEIEKWLKKSADINVKCVEKL